MRVNIPEDNEVKEKKHSFPYMSFSAKIQIEDLHD